MAGEIQLNLFGDIIDQEANRKTYKKEVKNAKSLVQDGEEALADSPAGLFRENIEERYPRSGAGNSRKSGGGDDGRSDGVGDEAERGHGDRIASDDTVETRTGGGGNSIIPKDELPRSPGLLRNGHTDDRGNYHITKEDPIGKGGKADKFLTNLEAIRIIKTIEQEKRSATIEEQSKLVKYTGWGGLSEVFKERHTGIWAERHHQLKEILTEQEYRSASRSTLNAHYTDPVVAKAMWDGLCRMGYFGGPTMEPACGVGHFFGTRPPHIPVEMHGIELDSMSGRIARQLYQSADIRINAYENIRIPESY